MSETKHIFAPTLQRMASCSTLNCALFFLAAVFAASTRLVRAGDPDIVSDFIIPENATNGAVDGDFFSFTGFRGILNAKPQEFKVTKASKAEFPALDGQSVSLAVLQYPSQGMNPPHVHPRAAELLFVLQGWLEVGLVDSTGKFFSKTLQKGDMFVFPKGLVHYQFNPVANRQAIAVSAFGSASAGTVSLPATLFGAGIDDGILAKAFKTDAGTIQKIKAGFGMKA